ncbi:MAG: methyl-accepting chemotaxis protein [Pseudomonadota bacterium]
MEQSASIDRLRATAAKISVGVLFSYVILLGGVAVIVAPEALIQSVVILTLNAAGCALTWRAQPNASLTRIVLCVGLIVGPIVSLGIFSGHPWQLDLHMGFFAALAMSALFCDWRGVIAAAAATAVHHLALNFLVPALLFPGGTDLLRVMLHALVVVAETGGLLWLTHALGRALDLSDQKIREADEQSARIEQLSAERIEAAEQQRRAEEERLRIEAAAEAEERERQQQLEAERLRAETEAQQRSRDEKERQATLRRDAERREQEAAEAQRRAMILKLSTVIGDVVVAAQAGDFTKTVPEDFDDPELNTLASNFNRLIATVKTGLDETITVLRAVRNSDLTRHVEGSYQGVFAELQQGVNGSTESLANILSNLRHSSTQVAGSLEQLLGGVNTLATKASNQAATLEETTATLKLFSTGITETAQYTEDMRNNARETQAKAEKSGAVMQQANEAMDQVAASSAKMSEITEVIESIAFQTNLLALNAGVEAARAGDAGRGFAVVASEVRNLAQSTADASKEVGQLLSQSREQIKGGVELVTTAASDIKGIIEEVSEIVSAIDRISQSAQEQNATISEINAAMVSLDEVTQANAMLAEQNTSAIANTKAVFSQVDEIVDRFQLRDGVVTTSVAA